MCVCVHIAMKAQSNVCVCVCVHIAMKAQSNVCARVCVCVCVSDFLGGPVAKAPGSQFRRPEFDP